MDPETLINQCQSMVDLEQRAGLTRLGSPSGLAQAGPHQLRVRGSIPTLGPNPSWSGVRLTYSQLRLCFLRFSLSNATLA
jgi:hypothetical protein